MLQFEREAQTLRSLSHPGEQLLYFENMMHNLHVYIPDVWDGRAWFPAFY